MQIICVDDEALVLGLTVSLCKELPQKPQAEGFQKAGDALEWLKTHEADIAILDINMPDMDGITLAAKIKEMRPYTAIIFLTGHTQYAVDAFGLHASGYLLKPVSAQRLADEVSYALDVTRYVEVHREVKVGTRNVPAGRELTVYPSVADVVFRCVFPLASDPTESISFYVDYNDFVHSINGRCVPRDSGLPASVIDYALDPGVLECIESVLR